MAGALGGATLAVAIGYILESTGKNYSLIFLIASFVYLFALVVIHLLTPRLEQVDDIEVAAAGGALSIGTFVGFGFMGLILGSFVGWCAGLIMRAVGVDLLKYMLVSGLVATVLGVLAGVFITKSGSRPAAA
jgi:hypothetical protein